MKKDRKKEIKKEYKSGNQYFNEIKEHTEEQKSNDNTSCHKGN